MQQESADFGLDICLAVPPFHPLHFPALGVSILKRACEARGFSAMVVYGAFPLATLAGFEPYDRICRASKSPMIA